MEEIADRAGAGVATIYRRFVGKDALIDSLVQQLADEIAQAAGEALSLDGGVGLEWFLTYVGETPSAARQYAELWLDREVDPATSRTIRAAIAKLGKKAVSTGVLRPGATTAADLLAWSAR